MWLGKPWERRSSSTILPVNALPSPERWPLGVELGGGLGVGVIVEQPVEQRERVGVRLPQVPRAGWDRDREAGGLAAAEADVEVDLVGLVEGDVFDQEAGDAFAFALRGGGV